MAKNKHKAIPDGDILAYAIDLQRLLDKRFPRSPQGTIALLAKLAGTGKALFSDVMAALGFTQSRCSRVSESLAEHGFITRGPAQDARQTILTLTPKGVTLVREMGDVMRRAMSQIYS